LGRVRDSPLGPPDGGDDELPDAAPPGASSPGVAPPEPAPAAALDSSEAAAPRPLVTAVLEKLLQVQLFKNTDLSRFSPTPKNLISQSLISRSRT